MPTPLPPQNRTAVGRSVRPFSIGPTPWEVTRHHELITAKAISKIPGPLRVLQLGWVQNILQMGVQLSPEAALVHEILLEQATGLTRLYLQMVTILRRKGHTPENMMVIFVPESQSGSIGHRVLGLAEGANIGTEAVDQYLQEQHPLYGILFFEDQFSDSTDTINSTLLTPSIICQLQVSMRMTGQEARFEMGTVVHLREPNDGHPHVGVVPPLGAYPADPDLDTDAGQLDASSTPEETAPARPSTPMPPYASLGQDLPSPEAEPALEAGEGVAPVEVVEGDTAAGTALLKPAQRPAPSPDPEEEDYEGDEEEPEADAYPDANDEYGDEDEGDMDDEDDPFDAEEEDPTA